MIEINFNHRIEQGILVVDKISVGHGLPQHGQLDFVTLITEYVALADGQILNAAWRRGFGWWRVVQFLKRKYKGLRQ